VLGNPAFQALATYTPARRGAQDARAGAWHNARVADLGSEPQARRA